MPFKRATALHAYCRDHPKSSIKMRPTLLGLPTSLPFSRLLIPRWPGLPLCTRWAYSSSILVETSNNALSIANPTSCRHPFISVRQRLCYVVQDPSKDLFTPTICKGGGPATFVVMHNVLCLPSLCLDRLRPENKKTAVGGHPERS